MQYVGIVSIQGSFTDSRDAGRLLDLNSNIKARQIIIYARKCGTESGLLLPSFHRESMTIDSLIKNAAVEFELSNILPLGYESGYQKNHVFSAIQKNKSVILKISEDSEELEREYNALKAFANLGGVGVLAYSKNSILLERIESGNSLKEYFPSDEETSVNILSEIIKKLQSAPRCSYIFPSIDKWLALLDEEAFYKNEDIADLIKKAAVIKNELLSVKKPQILLHGDLHHNNILKGSDGWKVIDPKGVIGEAEYEVGCFIRNPINELASHPDSINIIQNRISSLSAKLSYDSQRVAKWCFVQAALSFLFAKQDGVDTQSFKRQVEFFAQRHHNSRLCSSRVTFFGFL